MEKNSGKRSTKSILADLTKIAIADPIRNEAERIFQQLDLKTKRGGKRKRLLFYCIYHAYNTLGQTKDPKIIANLVGIESTEISKAFSMCSPLQTNYQPPSAHHSPQEYIREYISMVGLNPDSLQDCLDLCDDIMKADPNLEEEYPQNVAAAVIHLFIIINGGKTDRKKFSEVFGLSDMTVYKMCNRVSEAYNK